MNDAQLNHYEYHKNMNDAQLNHYDHSKYNYQLQYHPNEYHKYKYELLFHHYDHSKYMNLLLFHHYVHSKYMNLLLFHHYVHDKYKYELLFLQYDQHMPLDISFRFHDNIKNVEKIAQIFLVVMVCPLFFIIFFFGRFKFCYITSQTKIVVTFFTFFRFIS